MPHAKGGNVKQSPLLRTPMSWKGRVFLFLVSVSGTYAAQWLLYWATGWQQIRPSDSTVLMLAIIFGIFAATIPGGKPWFSNSSRSPNRKDDS